VTAAKSRRRDMGIRWSGVVDGSVGFTEISP